MNIGSDYLPALIVLAIDLQNIQIYIGQIPNILLLRIDQPSIAIRADCTNPVTWHQCKEIAVVPHRTEAFSHKSNLMSHVNDFIITG